MAQRENFAFLNTLGGKGASKWGAMMGSRGD